MTSVRNHRQLLSGSKILFLFSLLLFISSCGLLNKTRDNNKDKVAKDIVETEIDTLEITQIPESELLPIKKAPKEEELEDDFSAYKKDLYKIGMLIPFNASDVNFDINDGSDQKFVNYYAGVKLALEDFDAQGENFEVLTFDSERSKATVEAKLNDGSLDDVDIIVGPYDREGLSFTAEYGKSKNVAVISPWLSSTKITDDNPFYIQLRPSLSSHYFKMINHANQNFANDEIILVGRDINTDKNRFKYFQKTYSAINDFANNDSLTEYYVSEDSLTYADIAFRGVFEGKEKIALILPNWNYNDEDFIYSILRRLNIERGETELYVYGMPIIFDSEKIDFEFYYNLNLRICLSEFVDWEEERVKNFMRRFYEVYGALPTSDAFEGYDMMHFIGSNLIKYGINFQLYLEQDRNRYLQTAYDIQKIYDIEDEQFEHIKYLENKHLDLIQFQGNKFCKDWTRFPVHLTPERSKRIRELASNRQMDLSIVLENVHDPHNIGAVIRTCDAVGIPKVYLLVSDARVWERIEIGINASSGARKWVDVYIYDDYKKCFDHLRKMHKQIVGTHLSQESVQLYDIDMCESTAIVLGNEHEGLSNEALQYLDGNFIIPQFGMVQSLNISVACAISAYEALRQRMLAGKYSADPLSEQQEVLHQDYRQRNLIQHKGNFGNIVRD